MSIDARLLELGDELRREGVAIGTSELLDAFAALAEVDWRERTTFQLALAATLAKSPEDRRIFDLVFERFLFRASEAAALDAGVAELGVGTSAGSGSDAADQIDLDELRTQIAQALADGDEGRLRDLARLALAALSRATQGVERRGARRRAHVDIRRTMRASLQTGGVPVVLKYRPLRPRRPEIYVLCDVSTSVTSASVFFLSVLHALHDSFRRMRSFVFIERISEVTDIFERERDFRAISDAIASDAGVADVSGYTDYGRVWSEFRALVEDDLHPRATVIVLGDARTNGRDPRADIFATIAARAGRTFWLNPEPRLYWNYGDSVIDAYAPYCTAFECWTTHQLEDFVRALTRSPSRG